METRELAYGEYRDLIVGTGTDAVVVVPDYHGFTPYAQAIAERLAQTTGRCGVLLDLYGTRGMPTSGADAFAAISPMMSDRSLGLARLQAAVDQLRTQGMKRIVAIGYSCGGTIVFDAARTGMAIEGVAGFFGLVDPLDNRPRVMRQAPEHRVPVLAMVGGRDDLITPDTWVSFTEELEAFGLDWQLHILGGAKHAFTLRQEDNLEVQSGEQPALQLYDEPADRRSWTLLDGFLGECFA